jgi:ectoine hydroxylase-related dioxygenase (phytanoyl-CoA dioxygenase family)
MASIMLHRAAALSRPAARALATQPAGSSINLDQHAMAEALRAEQNADIHVPDPARAGAFADAVRQYNEDGYTILRGVLDPDTMAEMADHFDFLTRRYPDIPTEHLHHPVMRNDPFWVRCVSDPRLLDVADGFLGSPEGLALFSSHYFCKMPGKGMPVLWHQDGSYWPIRPMTVTTLWLAVDRSDEENGCLRVVRGSHRQTLKDLKDDRSVHNVLGAATHDDSQIDSSEIVDIVLEPGDVSIHHPNVVHGSKANVSDRRRCGLTVRYIPTSTEVVMKEQPVLHMRGDPGTRNEYRSWPPFRPEGEWGDYAFRGAETWNARRYVNPSDEHFFSRDPSEVHAEINAETLAFVDALGGRHA